MIINLVTFLDAVLNLAKERGENRGDEGLAHPAKSLRNFSCDTTNLASHTLLLDRCKSGSDDIIIIKERIGCCIVLQCTLMEYSFSDIALDFYA